MKLLMVAEGVPNRDPVHGDGSSMISYELIRTLPADVRLTLVTFGDAATIPPEVNARCQEVVMLASRNHRLALIRSLLSDRQVGAEERSTRQARRTIAELSGRHDVCLIHGPHAQFLAGSVQGPLVVQSVDPWSLRMSMEARLASGPLRLYRRLKSRRVLRSERKLPPRARLLTVGQRDAQSWSGQLRRSVRSIPNGVDAASRGVRRPGPPVVCFVGSLNYGPNIESVLVLIQQIAPLVWADYPETRFVIAGRQPDQAVLQLKSARVEVLANVPSVTEVFNGADVAVFPDLHGLGVRNSVREALAAGIPVVATSAAARELVAQPSLVTAEEVPELAAHVIRLLGAAINTPVSVPADVPVTVPAGAPGNIVDDVAGDADRPDGPPPEGTLRSWKTATDEYLFELHEACRLAR